MNSFQLEHVFCTVVKAAKEVKVQHFLDWLDQ